MKIGDKTQGYNTTFKAKIVDKSTFEILPQTTRNQIVSAIKRTGGNDEQVSGFVNYYNRFVQSLTDLLTRVDKDLVEIEKQKKLQAKDEMRRFRLWQQQKDKSGSAIDPSGRPIFIGGRYNLEDNRYFGENDVFTLESAIQEDKKSPISLCLDVIIDFLNKGKKTKIKIRLGEFDLSKPTTNFPQNLDHLMVSRCTAQTILTRGTTNGDFSMLPMSQNFRFSDFGKIHDVSGTPRME